MNTPKYRAKTFALLDNDHNLKESTALLSLGCNRSTYFKNKRLWKKKQAKLNKDKTPKKSNNKKTRTKSVKNVPSNQLQQNSPILTLPVDDPGFPSFCRQAMFPKYKGLYQWQEECWEEIKDEKVSEIKVPRDNGKSIFLGGIMQYLIQYKDFDVLYMGWTDRRKQVAQNVSNFFEKSGEIADKKSDYHFTTKNGGKFDCYMVKSKDVLGFHSVGDQGRFSNLTPEEVKDFKDFYKHLDDSELDTFLNERNLDRQLIIIIDDPIDDSFLHERHKEEELETRFASTIYNINPDKWIFVGTKKFEEDFFYFVEKMFKGQIVVFCRKTHLQEGEVRYDGDLISNPNNLLCPERFTEVGMPNYEQDKKPRHEGGLGKRDLTEIYNALLNAGRLYWWFAEYEQDPHPLAGSVWTKVKYQAHVETPLHKFYDMYFGYVDRATTTKVKSDDTGVLLGYREFKTGDRLITDDWTGKIPLEKLLYDLTTHFDHLYKQHSRIRQVLVVEKQGGGDDFEAMFNTRLEFEWEGKKVKNTLRNRVSLIMVHSTGDKISRIQYRLYAPINNGTIKFLKVLRYSPIIRQILQHPHSAKFDSIDCLATGDFEILQLPVLTSDDPWEGIKNAFSDYTNATPDAHDTVFQQSSHPELDKIKRGNKRRTVW